MKRFAFILLALVALSSCDKTINKFKTYEPVYTDAATFRAPASFEAPRSISQKGNIYFKDNYLFVVEPNKGIHFINNQNPADPQNVGFLKIMGASGLAIKGDLVYVTALVDLVIVDVSNISNPVEVGREEELFPTALPIMSKKYGTKTIDKSKGIVTDWNVIDEKTEGNEELQWTGCLGCEMLTTTGNSGFSINESSGGGSTGTAGSYALMTISGNHLYVIDNNKLKPYSLANPLAPEGGDEQYLSWDAETIFPNEGYLYIGTSSGMMIYNTDEPSAPKYTGSISHARGCDPVVVQGDYAYVTVRSGGPCGGTINQMDVVDVSSKWNPVLVETVQLSNPHGVGVDGNTVFVCDGDKGLKVYDATTKNNVGNNLIKRFGNIQATDVIPMDGVLMLIGDDGIFQYDYTDPENLNLLSSIKF